MSAAVGHGPYALGYQTAFDSGKSALTKHNIALNYNAGDMVMHGSLADFKVKSITDMPITIMMNLNELLFMNTHDHFQ